MERICTQNIELLAVSLHPHYLPREFTSVILFIMYILPGTAAETVCDVIGSVVARLEAQHPNAFMGISGDFNQVSSQLQFQPFNCL